MEHKKKVKQNFWDTPGMELVRISQLLDRDELDPHDRKYFYNRARKLKSRVENPSPYFLVKGACGGGPNAMSLVERRYYESLKKLETEALKI